MSINHFRRGLVLASILCFLIGPLVTSVAYAADVTVFAAASLKNALDDATKLYEAKTGDRVAISYAASPGLAKQIEAGAPADIFFSADLDWMDYLAQKNLINNASRQTLLGNTLVLVAPKAGDGKRRQCSGREIRQGSPDQPWGLGRSIAARRSGGKCPGCSSFGRQGRSTARNRLWDGRQVGAGGQSGGRLSRRKPPQNPVSRGVAHVREVRGSQISRLSRISRGEAGLRGPGVHLPGREELEEAEG
jgi:Bacterial extracellular solute-binding protein